MKPMTITHLENWARMEDDQTRSVYMSHLCPRRSVARWLYVTVKGEGFAYTLETGRKVELIDRQRAEDLLADEYRARANR